MKRLAILLALLGFCIDNWLPWLFAEVLFMCIIANEHRLTAHQYLGMLSLVLGFCIGNFCNNFFGSALMLYGRLQFEAAILRVYKNHTWAVSGLSLAVYLVHAGLEELAGRMVTSQAFVKVCRLCTVLWLWLDIQLGVFTGSYSADELADMDFGSNGY